MADANGNGNGLLREVLVKSGFSSLLLLMAFVGMYQFGQGVIVPLFNKHCELIDQLRSTMIRHETALEVQTDSLRQLEELHHDACELLKTNTQCNEKILKLLEDRE